MKRQRDQGEESDQDSDVGAVEEEDDVITPADHRCSSIVPHKGSFAMDDIKASPEWTKRRIPDDKAPKRKYALVVGYCGAGYSGLQINPGTVTVGSHFCL